MSGLNQNVLSVFHLLPVFTFFFPSFGLIHLDVPLPSYSCLHSATFHHSSFSWTISSLVLRSCHQRGCSTKASSTQANPGWRKVQLKQITCSRMVLKSGQQATGCALWIARNPHREAAYPGPPARGSSFRRLRPTWTRSRSRCPVVECTQIESSPEPALAQWEGGAQFSWSSSEGVDASSLTDVVDVLAVDLEVDDFGCDAHTE